MGNTVNSSDIDETANSSVIGKAVNLARAIPLSPSKIRRTPDSVVMSLLSSVVIRIAILHIHPDKSNWYTTNIAIAKQIIDM